MVPVATHDTIVITATQTVIHATKAKAITYIRTVIDLGFELITISEVDGFAGLRNYSAST